MTFLSPFTSYPTFLQFYFATSSHLLLSIVYLKHFDIHVAVLQSMDHSYANELISGKF
jgi:hypothetical protein